jgi:hypothetical protein
VQYFAMIEDITVKKNVAFTNRIWKRLSFLIRNLQTGVVLEDEIVKWYWSIRHLYYVWSRKDSEMLIGTDD